MAESEQDQSKNKSAKINGRQGNFRKPKSFMKKPTRIVPSKVSIVIPLFNEEESLRPLSSEITTVCTEKHIEFEVIFIDDGSTDNSLKIIREICRTDMRFKFVSFQKNYGKAAALQVGFAKVSGGYVITMDADLQDDPREIPNLLKKLNEGFDLVSGWKKVRHDPFIKRHSSSFSILLRAL